MHAAVSERRQPILSPCHRPPFWSLGEATTTTRQGLSPETPLDAITWTALRTGCQKNETATYVEVKRHVVIGTQAAVDQVLKAYGWVINTSFVERLNLSLRQRVAPIRRRSATSCKGEAGLDSPLSLFQVYYNFVLPHVSLRQALAEPMATNGSGSAKLWQPRTPAMAAGLTDHWWSLREVLMFRVPPWPQPQTI